MIDFPLYFLSFDYDTQKDLINMLLSANSPIRNKYTKKETRLLSEPEISTIETYCKLCDTLKAKPTIDLLKQTFPTMVFENIVPLNYEQLSERIKLDIHSRVESDSSQELQRIANTIRTEGMSAELIDSILDITKVESADDNNYRDLRPNLKDIYTNASLIKGMKTGVKRIDDITGGLQPGTFNCLAGFAGAGKTTIAVNIAYNAMVEGKNVCYLTLEVPKIDMYYNFGSRHSFDKKFKKPISHSDVKKKELPKADVDYFFDEVLPDMDNIPGKLYILDETEIDTYTFQSFENKISVCDKLATKETGHGIDLLVIDQAQLLKFSTNMSLAGQETSVINLYVSFFRQQAINFLHSKRPCTVLMLSQLNREGFYQASKNGGRYTLTALAEANELERASAMVMTVFSDESLKASKQIQIQLLKSRNGETMQDPAVAFFDPVYYVFGSDVGQSGEMFSGSSNELFGAPAIDLTSLGISDDGTVL
jgi:replicative DNA helicase